MTDPDPQPAGHPAGRPAGQPAGLSELDVAILDLERGWWRVAGAKEAAVRDRFGLTTVQYHQALGRLLDDDAALAHDPLLVRRLRRQRLLRRRERTERRSGRA